MRDQYKVLTEKYEQVQEALTKTKQIVIKVIEDFIRNVNSIETLKEWNSKNNDVTEFIANLSSDEYILLFCKAVENVIGVNVTPDEYEKTDIRVKFGNFRYYDFPKNFNTYKPPLHPVAVMLGVMVSIYMFQERMKKFKDATHFTKSFIGDSEILLKDLQYWLKVKEQLYKQKQAQDSLKKGSEEAGVNLDI